MGKWQLRQVVIAFNILLCSHALTTTEKHQCSHATSCLHDQDATSLLQSGQKIMMGSSRALEPTHNEMVGSRGYFWIRDHLENFWDQRGGDGRSSSSTPYVGPSNFSRGPAWTWSNSDDEEVRHSPLIDSHKNIYVATATKIRKFNADGKQLWSWETDHHDGNMVASPALYEGSVYAVTSGPPGSVSMYSIDMLHGTLNWKKFNESMLQHVDASSVFVYNKTILIGAMKEVRYWNGNTIVHAASTVDGGFRWQFEADNGVENFSPATPGDGTILFADNCGGVYRIDFDGKLIWRAGTPRLDHWCSMGGGALGPNGVYYIEYNDKWNATDGAHIKAYNVDDGSLLWNKTFEAAYGGWQYPSVGKLGTHGPLAVVVAVGNITHAPLYAGEEALDPHPHLKNAVFALDAASGERIWQFEEDPWDHNYAAGDFDGFWHRSLRAFRPHYDVFSAKEKHREWYNYNVRRDWFCAPSIQGAPLIAGDGTVYMSSGHSGDLRAIKDKDGNGVIDQDEVSLFRTHQCFSNSPSLAPDMLVAAPCWGPMYVFKN